MPDIGRTSNPPLNPNNPPQGSESISPMKTQFSSRPVTAAIFRAHVKHRVTPQWQTYSKWIAAFGGSVALYSGRKFVGVR